MLAIVLAVPSFAKDKKSKKNKTTTTTVEKTKTLTAKETLQQETLLIDAMQDMILGNYEDAVVGFNRILQKDPTNHTAMYQLARIYYLNQNYDLAIVYAKQSIKYDNKNENYYLYLAEAYSQKGNFEEAANVYKSLIDINPREYNYYYDLAYFYAKSGDIKKALETYNLLEQKIGIDEELVYIKQNLWLKENKLEEAVNDIEKLIKQNPDNENYYLMMGELYESKELYNQALSTYQRLLDRSPDNAMAITYIAEVYRKQGDETKYNNYIKKLFENKNIDIDTKIITLLPLFEKLDVGTDEDKKEIQQILLDMSETLLQLYPNNVKTIATRADVLYNIDKKEEALALYEKAISYDSVPSTIWLQTYILCSELNDTLGLEKNSALGMEKNPENPFGYFYNAIANQQLKNYSKAYHAIQAGLNTEKESNPLNYQLKLQMLTTLGDIAYEAKKYNTMDSAYEAALEIDANNATTLNNYAYYLSLRYEQLEKAEKMSRKANLLEVNNSAFIDTYAWIMYQQKNYKEALIWIEDALALPNAQNRAELLEHYGDILFKLGKVDDAVKQWNSAIDKGGDKAALEKKIKEKDLP